MPKIDAKLTAAVTKAAEDLKITKQEAKSIVNAASKSGSKTPIDDVFQAVSKTKAMIETDATRYVLGNLDQKLTRKEWEAYASKAASTAGVWGPSDAGAKVLKRSELPAGVRKVFDKWQKSDPEDTPQVAMFEVSGKPVYLMNQYSEFGTSFGLFDEAGKAIPMTEDTVNVKRSRDRIQGIYDAAFSGPGLENWKNVVHHTDIGVSIMYTDVGDLVEHGGPRAAKDAAARLKREMGGSTAIYKNKKDGSYLIVANNKDYSDTKYALVGKDGKFKKEFSVDA